MARERMSPEEVLLYDSQMKRIKENIIQIRRKQQTIRERREIRKIELKRDERKKKVGIPR